MRKTWRRIFGTAALAAMLCLTGLVMSGEAQAQRFVVHGDGTVKDTVTGLMWTKDANLFDRSSWSDAKSKCSSFGVLWRLPSRDELAALYHAIQGEHPFTGVQTHPYWTSTPVEKMEDAAWVVNMYDGVLTGAMNHNPNYVWPVRDGQ